MLLNSLWGLLLFVTAQILSTGDCWMVSQKQRYKREWVIPAKKLTENVDYSQLPYISKMRSDVDKTMTLRYALRGPGVNQPPVGNFMVEEYKGWVRATRPLDREERDKYTLIATAWFPNNSIVEDNIQLHIIVEDQNDNAPVFIKPERSSIYEGSPAGTFVTQVVAKDADEPNTLHTKIAYTLIKQEPNDGTLFFSINKDNGKISVENPSLDREKHRSYVLTVQAADMYGGPQGNSATASVSIDVLDVNDNIPTLDKDEYSASIDENEAPIEVLQIQAQDFDEERTDNWLAEFVIVSGNEDGHFSVKTDPKTNMGTLYLNKPLDFESSSKLNLALAVVNKAPPGAPLGSGAGAAGASIGEGGAASGAGGQAGASGADGQSGASAAGGQSGASGAGGQSGASGAGGQSGASGAGDKAGTDPQTMLFGGGGNTGSSVSKPKTYLVKIDVKNKPEAPKFKPNIKSISVSENTNNSVPRVIDTYTATDEDTGKPAEKVKYAKTYDPDNWISIDMDTAEIKLNKVPDRESPYVVNGAYYAKILCITDELHSKTSTGTIALQVEDLNDNCPKLLNNVQTVCSGTRELNITAEDSDSDPNGAPLEFSLIQEKTRGKWNLQRINDVGVSLLSEDDLWPGFYQVTMEIRDMQGLACPDEQVLHLEVCTCSEGTNCNAKVAAVHSSTSAKFGAPGISSLVLGFLSLILALLVLFKCECGRAEKLFIDMPFDTEQHISYCTEAKGEDRNVPLMSVPPRFNNEGGCEIKMSNEPFKMVPAKNSKMTMDEIQALSSNQTVCNSSKMVGMMQESAFGGFYNDTDKTDMDNTARGQKQHEVLLDALLRDYLMQKSRWDDLPGYEIKSYDYEGEGSVAGSIGSCSYSESKDDLEFLNNLNSKFRTLSEVCGYRQTQSVSQADPEVVVNTLEPTPTTTAFTAIPSSQMANTIQTSPLEISVKSPFVQTTPSQEMAIQEPMNYGLNQPMPSNVLLSEDGLGQGVYIINGTPETDRLLNQGNSHTLAYLGSGQHGFVANGITGDPIMYSQIGPESAVMISEGLGEANSAIIQNLLPTSNLVMMPQQQQDGIGSLHMVAHGVPVGSVESGSGNNRHGTVTLIDGSVSGGNVLVGGLGPSHHPISLQSLYPVSSQELSGPNQIIVDGSFTNAKNEGQGKVILECPINGGNVFVGGQGTPKLLSMPQIASGRENSQILVSGPFSSAPNTASADGGKSRLLVSGPPILEGQRPLVITPRALSPGGMPQTANRQLFRSKVSRVMTSMVMAPRSKGFVTKEHLNINS